MIDEAVAAGPGIRIFNRDSLFRFIDAQEGRLILNDEMVEGWDYFDYAITDDAMTIEIQYATEVEEEWKLEGPMIFQVGDDGVYRYMAIGECVYRDVPWAEDYE